MIMGIGVLDKLAMCVKLMLIHDTLIACMLLLFIHDVWC